MFETTTPTSNFRCIFVAALERYRKKTKTDLLTHPLSTQLQSCSTPSDILAVLHDKANEFDQSRSRNERLSTWLKPTIYVLSAFSATLGDGFGLVRPKLSTLPPCSPNLFRRYSHPQKLSLPVLGSSLWRDLPWFPRRTVLNSDIC
jgi:hypothetical protein